MRRCSDPKRRAAYDRDHPRALGSRSPVAVRRSAGGPHIVLGAPARATLLVGDVEVVPPTAATSSVDPTHAAALAFVFVLLGASPSPRRR
jgi:hypothetical protein